MPLSMQKCLSKFYFTLFSVVLLSAAGVSAQTKKIPIKPPPKQNSKQVDSKKPSKIVAPTSKINPADAKKNAETKKRADAEAAKKRAADEARRQNILADQRRRAEIARQAQARRQAFESGLRAETVENIGSDNIEGEDLEVRAAAVNALGNHAGTIVVLEPQTGRILTIVNQDWAIRQSFKPCSTIKLVTAVAGINEGVIGDNGGILTRRFPMLLDDALAFSNNSYFQNVGASLGSEKMVTYARMLGLGQPTGINAANETGGRVPFNNNNARIYSHGDDFEVTPLQLAVLVSAISNGGKIIVPQIPRTRIEKANFRGAMRYQLNLPNDSLREVIPGMVGAASYGTARRGMDAALDVAGKTGSCIGQGSWLGLFASVAPVENPKIAVIVITRGQAERGKYAAAIAANIYQALRSRVVGKNNQTIAKIPLELKPQPKVNAKTSAKLDTAEGEDSDDNDAALSSAPTTRKGKKGTDSNDSFPTVVIEVKKPVELQTRPRIVPPQ